nr:MAG TPA: hypothetical protein [Caudoviricetes sp.]
MLFIHMKIQKPNKHRAKNAKNSTKQSYTIFIAVFLPILNTYANFAVKISNQYI